MSGEHLVAVCNDVLTRMVKSDPWIETNIPALIEGYAAFGMPWLMHKLRCLDVERRRANDQGECYG